MEYFAVALFIISVIFLITSVLIIRWGESTKVIEGYEMMKSANQKATEALKLSQANVETVGNFNTRINSILDIIKKLTKDCEQNDQATGENLAKCQILQEKLIELREKVADKNQNVTITLTEQNVQKSLKTEGVGVKALIQETAKKSKDFRK